MGRVHPGGKAIDVQAQQRSCYDGEIVKIRVGSFAVGFSQLGCRHEVCGCTCRAWKGRVRLHSVTSYDVSLGDAAVCTPSSRSFGQGG